MVRAATICSRHTILAVRDRTHPSDCLHLATALPTEPACDCVLLTRPRPQHQLVHVSKNCYAAYYVIISSHFAYSRVFRPACSSSGLVEVCSGLEDKKNVYCVTTSIPSSICVWWFRDTYHTQPASDSFYFSIIFIFMYAFYTS